MITITLNTDNAAFGLDASERGQEIARILRSLADRFAATDVTSGDKLRDYNGNTVGKVTDDDTEAA